jgi:hypothetical protein
MTAMKNQKRDMDSLVQLIAEKMFHGVLPPFPEVIIENVVKVACADANEETAQWFSDELYRALRSRLQAKKSADETTFLN